jgi:hypothetical protein
MKRGFTVPESTFRVHNAYTIASAWKLVTHSLYELARRDVTDGKIKEQIKKDEATRNIFLILYDLVNMIVQINQDKFSLLATTSGQNFLPFENLLTLKPGSSLQKLFQRGDRRKWE